MKMSVTVTYDNQATAEIALKAIRKATYDDESFTLTQVDNTVIVDLAESVYGNKIDLRRTRLNVMKLKSIMDILYALA